MPKVIEMFREQDIYCDVCGVELDPAKFDLYFTSGNCYGLLTGRYLCDDCLDGWVDGLYEDCCIDDWRMIG